MFAHRIAPLALSLFAGCSGGNVASSLATAPEFAPTDQTKCSVAKSQSRPLIVEWPSADRGDLETKAKSGVVAVRYSGCEMTILPHCAAPGKYQYTAFTRKDDLITIRDADELYANVPVGAAKLETKLAKKGELNVVMTMVGKFVSDRSAFDPADLVGECGGATHTVSAMTAGAFEFFAGAEADVAGGATIFGAGAGAKTSAARELLNRDGDKASCDKATDSDEKPPSGCGAIIRVEVTPLRSAQQSTSAPPPAPLRTSPRCGGTHGDSGRRHDRVHADDPRQRSHQRNLLRNVDLQKARAPLQRRRQVVHARCGGLLLHLLPPGGRGAVLSEPHDLPEAARGSISTGFHRHYAV